MKSWMKTLAGYYEVMRRKYPKEKLLIAFDIDGTILDMRHMIKYTLKTFDDGKAYDLKDLMSKNTMPKHIQFVWSCNYARESFASFIGSNISWLEIDLRDAQKVRSLNDENLSLEECLNFAKTGDKSVKLNVREGALSLDKALEIINFYDLYKSPLWLKVGDDHVLRRNRLAALKKAYPDAVIEHEVDFLVRPVLDEPDNAKYVLELLQKVGVNRFSLSRKQPQWRRVVNMLGNWGFDVHVDHVTSFETFLQAALLSPRSMTINLSPADWKYFNCTGEEEYLEDPLLKRIA